MPSYKAPGVYVQDIVSGSQSISLASSSVGILIGVAKAGITNTAVKIGSWTEFISNFANGLDTPFMENSYLPYAVHGFFTNGGKELYIGNVKKNAKKATKTGTSNPIKFTAKSEGVWGNDIKITIAKSEDFTDEVKLYDITIAIGATDNVVITDVTPESVCDMIGSNLKAKAWVEAEFTEGIPTELVAEEITLASGSDGDVLKDEDYVKALEMIDVLDDVTMVSIVGQTSKVVNDAILAYCDNNGLFPIIDMPIGSTTEQTKTYRKSIGAFTGALAHPWGKMNDPLTGSLKTVPACGHLMGVYARVIENRGVHKAPAGVDAVVRGFVEMEYHITPAQLGTLNPIGVVCIMSRPNAGIVVWGARSLNNSDSTMRYVTDGLLNLSIKKSLYNGTQFAVFEPNNEALWTKVESTCNAFLETLRQSGALKGSAEEAYYVTVNDTNNTDATIAEGQLNIEIGYAPVKPAEFVIIKLAHSMQN